MSIKKTEILKVGVYYMTKNKIRKENVIHIYIIPFVVITIISAIFMLAMSNSIKSYFYNFKKEEALKITKSISLDFSHTGAAVDIINKLLEDKLINLLKIADNYRGVYSDELLTELANKFDIDEIYAYNSEGVIEYSNSGKYIGWKANEGHPIHDFMLGQEDMLVEDIRKDSESDTYYKYGYLKDPDGGFIQIGILAEKINELFEPVRLQNHIDNMTTGGTIVQLYSLNTESIITASSNKDIIGLKMEEEAILAGINNGRIHERINANSGVDLYEIIVPLEYENENITAFGIQYSLDDIHPIIRRNILIFLVGVIIVYITLTYAIFSSYRRNKKLIELAFYDKLTGLPNAEYLKEYISMDLKKSKNSQAILMIKCDNLNIINLTFGYEYGDMVIKELGNRIKTLENKNIQLFKFTAEKFVMYIKHYKDKEDLLAIITKINDLIDPFIINDNSQNVVIKIGVTKYDATDKSLEQLLKDADIAIEYTDIAANSNYRFFDEDMELNIKREEMLERELRATISNQDKSSIYLAYQPKLDVKTNRIDGFEALARMNSENFGFVSPLEFIDIAERKRLIIPLSNYILKVACTFIADLLKRGFEDIHVAVNISTIHLLQDDFVSTVLDIIEEAGIIGRNLELELTETIIMDDLQVVNKRLKELKVNGIRISLDDFGTGYSSFDRLSELNVDTLKIDQYFIKNIMDCNKESVIAKDIISIAHRFGLQTVAEGVENTAQMDYLIENSCDKLQGYLISKPVPEEEAIMLLQKYN